MLELRTYGAHVGLPAVSPSQAALAVDAVRVRPAAAGSAVAVAPAGLAARQPRGPTASAP